MSKEKTMEIKEQLKEQFKKILDFLGGPEEPEEEENKQTPSDDLKSNTAN